MEESIRRKRLQIRDQMSLLEEALKDGGELVTEERLRITQMDPMELLRTLSEGELSASEVLKAFQSTALELTKSINCITEFIPEAQSWADACDRIPSEERGPLHGFPISIKDNLFVKGMDTTIGLAKHLYNPASCHSVIVDVLIKKGAVPFCKTNVPQTLLSFCCSNPVFGETANPVDPTRSPGGSSGGESALIGGGGSVLGIGTDLAGSVRVPANFSGCVSIKPTLNRLSFRGARRALEGMAGNVSTVGIMGKDCRIVTECFKVLVNADEMREKDLFVVPLPWNELTFSSYKKLVFGYFDNLDVFPATPGVRRAVLEARTALEKAGHDVVLFEIENMYEIYLDIITVLTADGGQTITTHLKKELVDPSLAKGMIVTTMSPSLKPLLKRFLKLKSTMAADIIQTSSYDSYNLWRSLFKREKTIVKISEQMKAKKIDLLLSPAYAIPAPQQFVPAVVFAACLYTVIFNFLDFPSGCVPVTTENETDQQMLDEYPEEEPLYKIAKQATRGAMGLPIGVLVSGITWEDELVARGMMELEKALKMHKERFI